MSREREIVERELELVNESMAEQKKLARGTGKYYSMSIVILDSKKEVLKTLLEKFDEED